ncbi:MAG: tRNA (guanosine(37)-N1)-methyltransferase TrmD, partial [Firmicutes bacterium]|nr:tRNA (guanosine(37)-N1)-methyltransferase TrmD [Bacillota bacterium]
MTIKIISLFPNMLSPLFDSITGRAIASGTLKIEVIDPRPFAADKKHFQVDDAPFGGGAGMVMMPQPLVDCIE